ncbi:hypothetical protein BK742_09060 [Bacillus thuringiensis serovar pingluonsis]|uniref:Uncharacterized protein n=1 Tax=Bacillus thuringiensis serovar pingluonsis TaxID=180881 RepID=A0A243BII4_BACTU|nr:MULTISPECIES: hypothetical protein [Bacillus cereus group]MEB9686081.1 hypothetical protein [Bacillus anthracis]OTY46731.1 hypothetical protein BK742_09060 [Bacillus thuringiensis serovar pingluonsis]
MEREILVSFLKLYQGIGAPCKEDIQFMMQQITANWPIQDEWRSQREIGCKKTEYSLSGTQIACLQTCIDCIWREEWIVFICELTNFISSNELNMQKEILEIERQTIHMLRGMVFQAKNFLETVEIG